MNIDPSENGYFSINIRERKDANSWAEPHPNYTFIPNRIIITLQNDSKVSKLQVEGSKYHSFSKHILQSGFETNRQILFLTNFKLKIKSLCYYTSIFC